MTPRLDGLGVSIADTVPHRVSQLSQSLGVPLIGQVLVVTSSALFVWVLADPFRASKVFWQILSFLVDRFSRRYTKAAVERDTNQFLAKKLYGHSADRPLPYLKLQWVTDAQDARLHTDGTIIVRMRHERDQSRNALIAVATAAKHIFFPHARPFLHKRLVVAVDLQVLRLLADALGDRAHHVFSTEFVAPQTAADPQVCDLMPILHDVERQGLFGQVLLTEFAYLSGRAKHTPPSKSLAEEAQRFVGWLHHIATRAPGDESGTLEFVGEHFRVAFILAAKSVTAAKGVNPYARRLGIELALGARSVYVLGLTPEQTHLCEQIGSHFDRDDRIERVRSATVVANRASGAVRLRIILFRRNELYMPDISFADQIAANGIAPGSQHVAEIKEIVVGRAILRLGSLDALLLSEDAAWGYRGDIGRFVSVNQKLNVKVLSIDEQWKTVIVGLRQLEDSPWSAGLVPANGQRLRVTVIEHRTDCLVVQLLAGGEVPMDRTSVAPSVPLRQSKFVGPIFARIPKSEWSWFDPTAETYVQPTINSSHDVVVIRADERRDDILLSRRVLEVRDWALAKRKYAVGTKVRATVLRVSSEGLHCELEPGVFGKVPDYKVRQHGFELTDFEVTVVPGAQYDVTVVGAKEKRREFRLELARLQ